MYLNQYQQEAGGTAMYPNKGDVGGLVYLALKLNGEAGEVAEKVGKALRDEAGVISEERRQALILELGDVLWYIANLGLELKVALDEIAFKNLDKLWKRKQAGTIKGDGDNR